jgi:hypothetical protein
MKLKIIRKRDGTCQDLFRSWAMSVVFLELIADDLFSQFPRPYDVRRESLRIWKDLLNEPSGILPSQDAGLG